MAIRTPPGKTRSITIALAAAATVAGLSTFAASSIDQAPSEQAAEAVKLGKLIASGGKAAGTACFSCHGMTGGGDAAGAFPKLAGLDPHYLYKQLDDHANGSRPNDIMTPIAQALSEDERAAVAIYYSGLKRTRFQARIRPARRWWRPAEFCGRQGRPNSASPPASAATGTKRSSGFPRSIRRWMASTRPISQASCCSGSRGGAQERSQWHDAAHRQAAFRRGDRSRRSLLSRLR